MIAALLLAAASPAVLPGQRIAQAETPPVEIWQVDQLRVARDTSEAKLKALVPDHSLDAVIAHLKQLGVPFTRSQVGMVPSRMPETLRTELAKLPQGEPFILPGDDAITVNVIVGKQLPPDTVRYAPLRSGLPGGSVA